MFIKLIVFLKIYKHFKSNDSLPMIRTCIVIQIKNINFKTKSNNEKIRKSYL